MVEQIAEDYPDRFAPITMHVNGDGFDIPWGQQRLDVFYGVPAAVPTFMVDALWNCQSSDYRYYVELELAKPTDVTLELSGSPVDGDTWDVTARVCLEGGGSRQVRVFTAATLDEHPDLQRYTTNLLMQTPKQSDIVLTGGGCENVTSRINFDSVSMANSSDIVIIAWTQKPSASAPSTVYQAGIMRWPFPSGSQLTSIVITPTDTTVNIGDQVEFTAVGRDQSGAVFPLANPEWSLGTGSGGGTFDPGSGNTTTFTATSTGTRQILCRDSGVSGAAIATILEAPVLTTIEIDPAPATVAVDGEIVFTAVGRDQFGGEMPLTEPAWTVTGDGDGDFEPATGATTTFTATYPGSAVVSCALGDVTGTSELDITGDDPRLASIAISPATAQIPVGSELELTAVGTDQYGRTTELTDPAWRVEGDGDGDFDPATGSATTTFTATTAGSAEFFCSADGIEGSATVEIAPQGQPAPRKVSGRVAP